MPRRPPPLGDGTSGPPPPGPPPYGPHPDKAAAVTAMFDRIAPRYDLLNRVLSLGFDRRWRREAAVAAAACAPERVLDVATGTGDLAFAIARAAPRARITAVDLSEAMLALARTKAARAGLDIDFRLGDALALPFADASFDAVGVAYGLRNFADPRAGLRELRRVLVRGGHLVVLEFPPPPERLVGRALRWYGRSVMPTIGGCLSGDRDAYTYLPASTRAFMTPERLLDELAACGFAPARARLQLWGASALYVAVAA